MAAISGLRHLRRGLLFVVHLHLRYGSLVNGCHLVSREEIPVRTAVPHLGHGVIPDAQTLDENDTLAVLTADTGMEFPEMYEHLQKLNDYLFAERGLHLTWLRHPKGFEWLMFEEKKQRPASIENRQRLGVSLYGNGWPGPRVRWCTGQLKTHLIHKEINRLKGQYKAVSYVGIAADEPKRIKNERYPLMDWGITEKEALRICYDRGYDFGGLYQIYRRCSCWCCPLQGIGELRKLRQHHPELWERLREMDKRALAQFGPGPLGQFKRDWSVERLEQRFAAETQQLSILSLQEERER